MDLTNEASHDQFTDLSLTLRLKKHWVVKRADSNAGVSELEANVRADPKREIRIEAGKAAPPHCPMDSRERPIA